MNQLTTPAELLETVQGLRAELDQTVAGIDPARIEQPGSFGEWSFKDLIAHLTAWRILTAERLEAPLRGDEPNVPWPAHLTEEENTDEINQWIFETNRDKSLETVMEESNATFDRVEQAITRLSEDDLFTHDRFPWLEGYALKAVVDGTWEHYHVDHKPDIEAWLAQG